MSHTDGNDLAGKKLDTSTGVSNPPKSPDTPDQVDAQEQFWALTEVSQLSPNTKAQLVALLLSERADELEALPVTTPQVGVPYVTEAYIASRYLELKRELEKKREADNG